MSIAAHLGRIGVPCVGIPKTIDGDVGGTEQTFGLDTAVDAATTPWTRCTPRPRPTSES